MDASSKPEVGIVKNSRLRHLFKSSKKNMAIAIFAVVVLIGAGTAWYLVLKPVHIASPPKADISDVADYSEMTYEQKNYYLYSKTGLTIEYLKSQKNLTAKSFKTFGAAKETSMLFTSLGEYDRAKQAYAAAEAKGAPEDDYQFHLDYAYIALLAKDKTTWKKEMLAARDIAAKRPKPSDNNAPTLTEIIDNRIKTTEASDE